MTKTIGTASLAVDQHPKQKVSILVALMNVLTTTVPDRLIIQRLSSKHLSSQWHSKSSIKCTSGENKCRFPPAYINTLEVLHYRMGLLAINLGHDSITIQQQSIIL